MPGFLSLFGARKKRVGLRKKSSTKKKTKKKKTKKVRSKTLAGLHVTSSFGIVQAWKIDGKAGKYYRSQGKLKKVKAGKRLFKATKSGKVEAVRYVKKKKEKKKKRK